MTDLAVALVLRIPVKNKGMEANFSGRKCWRKPHLVFPFRVAQTYFGISFVRLSENVLCSSRQSSSILNLDTFRRQALQSKTDLTIFSKRLLERVVKKQNHGVAEK